MRPLLLPLPSQGVRGVWFLVHLSDSAWVPLLADRGFTFHHTDVKDQLAMLRWLPEEEECLVRAAGRTDFDTQFQMIYLE